jgi:hypothetical protein
MVTTIMGKLTVEMQGKHWDAVRFDEDTAVLVDFQVIKLSDESVVNAVYQRHKRVRDDTLIFDVDTPVTMHNTQTGDVPCVVVGSRYMKDDDNWVFTLRSVVSPYTVYYDVPFQSSRVSVGYRMGVNKNGKNITIDNLTSVLHHTGCKFITNSSGTWMIPINSPEKGVVYPAEKRHRKANRDVRKLAVMKRQGVISW